MIVCDGCKQFIDMSEEKYFNDFIAGDTRIFHNEQCKQLFLERLKNEKDNGFKR